MGFYRYRTRRNRQYLYFEGGWREGGKVRSRSSLVKGSGPAATIAITVGLPAMMAYDLISGRRVEELKQLLAERERQPPPAHDTREAKAWKDWFKNQDRAYRENK